MISRTVDCKVKQEKFDEFRAKLANDLVPQIQQQPGFVDILESIDTESGHFVCTTLWNSSQDVQNYDNGLFQQIAGELVPLMEGAPTVNTMQVETSSAHKIGAGKSAAA